MQGIECAKAISPPLDLGTEPAEYAAGSGDPRHVVNRAIGYVESANVLPTVPGRPDRQRGTVNLTAIIRKGITSATSDVHGLPQFAFFSHRADHPKALCLAVVLVERPLFQHFTALFRGPIGFAYQIVPFLREYAGPAYSVAGESVCPQFVAVGRPNISDSLRLLFAYKRKPISGHDLAWGHGRVDDLDVIRMPHEPDDFRVFVTCRAEHALHVGIDESASQVEQDG